MSFRTILVGIIAAVCGTFATAGFMMLNNPQQVVTATPEGSVVVAKVNLDLGQEITAEMLTTVEWFAKALPAGSTNDPATLVGKYVATPIPAGDLITNQKLTNAPTGLQLSDGMRAFSIDARSVSANVGRNLIPGNRVDIIWQTNNKLSDTIDPVSMRLLQNVKILAVGDAKGGGGDRSITLEVKPKMDEDLAFSQAFGNLSLSLRNPNDNEGIDPIQSVTFSDLLARNEHEQRLKEEAARRPAAPSAWESMLSTIAGRIDQLEDSMKEKPATTGRAAYERIGKGMRAVTIRTPTESSGVAGLLVPGDRVDLQLTLNERSQSASTRVQDRSGISMPTENLMENIEVLAVDTQLQEIDDGGQRKMSRSVTLIVTDGMQRDIARAEQLGTLTLVLRGLEDRIDGPPQLVMGIDEFVIRYLPQDRTVGGSNVASTIRTIRGDASNDVIYTRMGRN